MSLLASSSPLEPPPHDRQKDQYRPTHQHSPTCHVEEIATDGGGDGHVPEALPGHDDGGDEIRDRRARRQDRQAHHLTKGKKGWSGEGKVDEVEKWKVKEGKVNV